MGERSWADELIEQYKDGRLVLEKMKDALGEDEADNNDRTQINSMIREMTENIKWLRTGRDPKESRGVGIKSVYQINHMSNMDLLPDILSQLSDEREPLELGKNEMDILIKVFSALSDRERDCFIMHVTQEMSMSKIGEKYGIKKTTVQNHIEKAREKIRKITS